MTPVKYSGNGATGHLIWLPSFWTTTLLWTCTFTCQGGRGGDGHRQRHSLEMFYSRCLSLQSVHPVFLWLTFDLPSLCLCSMAVVQATRFWLENEGNFIGRGKLTHEFLLQQQNQERFATQESVVGNQNLFISYTIGIKCINLLHYS